MKESHPFDALRQPTRNTPDRSPIFMSDEEWEKLLRDHDAALEVASRPRTIRQKLSDVGIGLISIIFFVGLGLLLGFPELREVVRQTIEQLVQTMR